MRNSSPSRDHPGARAAGPQGDAAAHCYRIFDFPISSELSLPELPVSTEPESYLTVRRATPGRVERGGFTTRHEWREAGEIVCRTAHGETGYLLSFASASFLLGQDGVISCAPAPGVGEDVVRHLLLNQVLPRCLAHTGELVLHASAVALPGGRTVAFLGESGYGKSTLAFYCHGKGAHLIDDDCVLLRNGKDGTTVSGGVPTVRLQTESLRALGGDPAAFVRSTADRNKQQMRLEHDPPTGVSPRLLDTLYLLDAPGAGLTPDTVRIEPATGQSAVMAVVSSAFNLDPSDHDTMTRTFMRVSQILGNGLRVYHLRYPRKYARLAQVWQALTEHPGS